MIVFKRNYHDRPRSSSFVVVRHNAVVVVVAEEDGKAFQPTKGMPLNNFFSLSLAPHSLICLQNPNQIKANEQSSNRNCAKYK
jgi:flavin reductase (DIM6/NTAB) family NADH-FMN oxidoreductase RutF